MPDARQYRHDDDHEHDRQQVFVDIGHPCSEDIAEDDQTDRPERGSGDIVCEKDRILHLGHAGEYRREGADDRHESGDHDRLATVLVIELLGLRDMILAK